MEGRILDWSFEYWDKRSIVKIQKEKPGISWPKSAWRLWYALLQWPIPVDLFMCRCEKRGQVIGPAGHSTCCALYYLPSTWRQSTSYQTAIHPDKCDSRLSAKSGVRKWLSAPGSGDDPVQGSASLNTLAPSEWVTLAYCTSMIGNTAV